MIDELGLSIFAPPMATVQIHEILLKLLNLVHVKAEL